MSRIVRIVAFGFGLAGAAVLSQGPEFSQQYRQRLGGAIGELNRVVSRFDQDSSAHGENRDSSIARLQANPDALAKQQGSAMQSNVDRLNRLDSQRQAMLQAGSFKRIAVMMKDGDRDVMRAAYGDFEPAIPITQEGILSAASGFVVVWGGILFCAACLRRMVKRRPRNVAA